MVEAPASRNALCPCGSGRRYKACHGALAAPPPPATGAVARMRDALALQTAGRLADAEAAYRAVLADDPSNFDALHMLGVIRHQRGDAGEAAACIGRALAVFPGHAPAHSNHGLALLALARADEALAAFERALALQPSLAEALANRGTALVRLGRHDEAVASFEAAHAQAPGRTDVLSNLGNALLEAKRHAEAAAVFARLLAADPHYPWAPGALLNARLACCDWRDLDASLLRSLDAVRRGQRTIAPFALMVAADAPADQRACAAIHAEQWAGVAPLPRVPPRAAQRLRVGFLSTDYRDHAMGYLMADVLETLDRARFEVVGLSIGPADASPTRRRIERACTAFHDLRAQDDAAVAHRMRELAIDIAVDLNGYTLGARPGILARRPAPVQVQYLGYPGTMGAPWIDYVLLDRHVAPPGAEDGFSERIVRLPDTYFASDRQRPLPADPPSRAAVGLPETGFVFGCFNNSAKILPPVFDVWMRLLAAVDGSVLWLLRDNDAVVAHLGAAATERGIDPARLRYAPRAPLAQHIARHVHVDLFCDTLPYNAHTTASDALWAGVPVLTCPGRSMASRVAASLLHAVELPELVVPDLAAYEATALALARAPERLAALRRHLAERRLRLPLFDTPRLCGAIGTAFETIWRRAVAGEPPVSFDVTL